MSKRAKKSAALPEPAIGALLAEHAAFRRFLIARLGSETDADDVLQESLQCALENGVSLRRHERIVAWFYRVLRNAIVDHYRKTNADRRRAERLANELRVNGGGLPSVEWERAVCACFEGLLPALKPRYAELIRRVDLRGEIKLVVAHDLKLSRAVFDVTLHRARQALRRQLEVLCGGVQPEKLSGVHFCPRSEKYFAKKRKGNNIAPSATTPPRA